MTTPQPPSDPQQSGQGEPSNGDPGPGQQSPQQVPSDGQPRAGQPADTGQADPGPAKVEDLPEWAQKLIRDTRTEAATNRSSKQQAEADKQATLDAVAAALGLNGDDKADPEKLAADLASAQAESRQRATELAVYRAAGGHGADPDALLDSRGFLERVAGLDPATGDFADRVGDAVKAAVAANPKLAATPAAPTSPTSAADMGQGRRHTTGPTGVQAGRALYQQRKAPAPPAIT